MIVSRSRSKKHAVRTRRGASMFEFAIVLPIFLLLVLGIIEMGRVMMLNQVITNASREGCRQSVVPGANTTMVTQVINDYLDQGGISEKGRSIQILDANGSSVNVEAVPSRESVTIRIEVPYSENTWGFSSIMGTKKAVSSVTMRRE